MDKGQESIAKCAGGSVEKPRQKGKGKMALLQRSKDVIQKLKNNDSPYCELKFSSYGPLEKNGGVRSLCGKCGRKRLHYCYTCRCLVGEYAGDLPTIKLPIKAHVIKHKNEKDSKSSVIPAAALSAGDIVIHTYPEMPDFKDPSRVLLLFPSNDAKEVADLSPNDFDEVAFIDSTWQQTRSILIDPRLQACTKVKIKSQKTAFWRYQTNLPDSCLATIEAIYFFYKEYHEKFGGCPYDGRYDDLLYFFHYQYNMIQSIYRKQGDS